MPDVLDVARSFSQKLNSPESSLVVARADSVVVGFVEINLLRPGNRPGMVKPRLVADIGIAVLSQYRHRGIGRRLMEAAESWARSRGAASITLNCHAANEEAVSFYGSIGYRTIGLFMVKPLGTTDQASGYDAESSPRS